MLIIGFRYKKVFFQITQYIVFAAQKKIFLYVDNHAH